jgi:glycosyltransferase involved in cell wall biosynthesis
MKVALLLSTYNWSEALELVLKSVGEQSVLPDQVIIADDGSGTDTKRVIESFKKDFKNPVIHIWQEDKGFRKAKILNKALAKITSDYVVQADGDCILHRDFIKDHVKFAKPNTYLFGSRVNIQKTFLPTLFSRKQTSFHYFSTGIKKRGRTLHFPLLTKFYSPTNQLSSKVRGCNISFWKKDLVEVNGFNEEMEGWGKEDSELVARLMNKGVKGKRMKFSGIVYHIWHKEKSRNQAKRNKEIEDLVREKKIIKTEKGLLQYL